jgi:hypothetical protein
MLDLYDLFAIHQPVDEETIKREIQCAHDNIVVAFEDSITERLRALLEPEDSS